MLKGLTVIGASLIISTGFIVGALILSDGYAHGKTQTVMAPAMQMSSGTMMGNANAAATPAAQKLNIVHVQRGCHVWSNGTNSGAMMRMMLAAGGTLRITDEDVDPHKLIQVGGPKVMLGKAMMTGDVAQISFPTKGVYKFTTKTLEMPGMAEVKTIGPDHHLMLTVNVA
jgi:hypothetical protein